MNSYKSFSAAFVLLVVLFFPGFAMAQEGPTLESTTMSTPDESASEGEELTKIVPQGGTIYLICIWGERDDGTIPLSCNAKEEWIRKTYGGALKIVRVDNPTKKRLENIRLRFQKDITVVHVVVHSTLDEDKPDGVDVWDCEISPTEFAELFPGSWVFWSGCQSRRICELADNILPSQCVAGNLHWTDVQWQKLYRCLERGGNKPVDRNEICSKVWGDKWREDAEPPPGPGPGAGPGLEE